MTLAATADLIAAAGAQGAAVAAFNVITIEHAEGIADGMERAGAAGLMQLSENTVRFHGGRIAPVISACARIAESSSASIALHLDHFQDPVLLGEAIDSASDLGISSIMVDAAHLPYPDNVERTHSIVHRARAAGLWVEAELGEIGGKGNAHAAGARTDPHEAAAFAEETGIDGLAVAVGSTHAMTSRDACLDVDLVAAISAHVAIPLVLHGSSGVPDDQLRAVVHAGIRKVNIGTALNLAYSGAVREVLGADLTVTDPRPYLAAARRAVGDTVAGLCRVVATPAPQGVPTGEQPSR